MTTPNHRNTRLTPCTCQRQLNQEHRRSRTRKAPKEPHVARWLGATRGSCATLLRACQCRPTPHALPLLQTSVGRTPKLAAVLHRHWTQAQRTCQECNRITSSGRETLWRLSSARIRQAHAPWSGLWPLTKAYIPEFRHTNPCIAPRVRCMPHSRTHAQRVTRKLSSSSRTKKNTVSRFHVSARLANLDLQGESSRQQ